MSSTDIGFERTPAAGRVGQVVPLPMDHHGSTQVPMKVVSKGFRVNSDSYMNTVGTWPEGVGKLLPKSTKKGSTQWHPTHVLRPFRGFSRQNWNRRLSRDNATARMYWI